MTSTHSFLSSLFVAALLSAGVWLSGCDYSDETTADNIGQVSVTGNEGFPLERKSISVAMVIIANYG